MESREENIIEYLNLASDFVLGMIWPTSFLAVVFYFRNQIKERFPHIRKISPGGVEMGPQKTTDFDAKNPTGLPVKPQNRSKSALTEKLEESIRIDLELFKTNEKMGVLVNALAISRIFTECERAYATIFGSQIQALQRLQNGGGQVPLNEITMVFEEAKAHDEDFYGNANFEAWFEFLEQSGLAVRDFDKIKITDFGQDFLGYIQSRGLSKFKAY